MTEPLPRWPFPVFLLAVIAAPFVLGSMLLLHRFKRGK